MKQHHTELPASEEGSESGKVWGGRFRSGPDELMERFSSSLAVDKIMWQEDIAVNRAWAKALRRAEILQEDEEKTILGAFDKIAEEFRRQEFQFNQHDEDIHVAIERRLIEITGDTGAKIHTGRSRNDQVVTDLRMHLKKRVPALQHDICQTARVFVDQAQQNLGVIVPGYTHTQQAQPVRLSHYLMSGYWSLQRHHRQLQDYRVRIDELPLGSGALAGTAFLIDRKFLARELGFAKVMQNSIDATGSRSCCNELAFICAEIMTTLSRYCHDFILWSSREFGFIDLGEKFATGSSMMPNKKNPDAFELVRGRSGQVIGILTGLLTMQRGLPVTYSRDLQEDKKALFETLQNTGDCLQVFAGALATSSFRERQMEEAIDSALFATDIADYLVKKGVPFRQAHFIVARAVQHAEKISYQLHELPLSFWLALHPAFDEEVKKCFSARKSVETRDAIGGTSARQVERQIKQAQKWLRSQSAEFSSEPSTPERLQQS